MAPPSSTAGLRLAELAALTGAQLDGDGDVRVTRVATLERAGAGAIAFLANPRYRSALASTGASAVIVRPEDATATALPRLVHANPYAVYAKVAAALHPTAAPVPGVHPSAIVASSARVAASAAIGAGAVIGERATVGERASIGALCVIGADASLADDVLLHPSVTLYPRTTIGPRTIVHSGAVIGADGFGMAEEGGRWLKVAQLGRAVIGADVEIGANTTIDRATTDSTRIGDGTKIDNLVQIGHNVVIGKHCIIVAQVGISGSTELEDFVTIGGQSGIIGHVKLGKGMQVGAQSGVSKSWPAGTTVFGTPAAPLSLFKRINAYLQRLPQLFDRTKTLEGRVAKLEESQKESLR